MSMHMFAHAGAEPLVEHILFMFFLLNLEFYYAF